MQINFTSLLSILVGALTSGENFSEIRSSHFENSELECAHCYCLTKQQESYYGEAMHEGRKCTIIEKLPKKLNIVQAAPDTMTAMLHPLIGEVRVRGKLAKKTITLCKSYTDLIEVTSILVTKLHDCDCLFVEASDCSKKRTSL